MSKRARLEVQHPLGILPEGNAYVDPHGNRKRHVGLGMFSKLEDETFLEVLGFLSGKDAIQSETVSPAFMAFAREEGVWKERCLDMNYSKFHHSWRSTFIAGEYGVIPSEESLIKLEGIYSDHLFYAVQCRRYYADLKHKYDCDFKGNVQLVDRDTLDRVTFVDKFEKTGKPILINGLVQQWPAFKNWTSREYLLNKCGDNKVACGTALWTLKEYYQYADNCVWDEVPFFVFENKFFAESELASDFTHDEIFGPNMFDVLSPPFKPDNRWLLIGNQMSFSQWHIDPNSTTAWNGVIQGRKLWLLLPPSCVPAGVFPSSDGSAVRQPHSLLEWFGNGLYEETKEMYGKKLHECICGPGQLMVIPRGWWHCVVNLEDDTVAVTQNFCPETHVHSVRRFLKESKHCVSGIDHELRDDLWHEFDAALMKQRPDVLPPKQTIEADKVATSCEGFSFWNHLRTSSETLSFSK